jgi:progranulin
MRQFLSLPTSLLLLIAATSALSSSNELQWPYNLPKEARYYPEDEPLIRRDVEISQRLLYQKPLGMRKMSDDEGEKFFMEYWLFDEGTAEAVMDRTDPTETVKQRLRPNKMLENVVAQNWVNESLSCAPRPAFPFHFDKDPSIDLPILGRHFRLPRTLERRDFQCPDGTSACTSLNRPDSCCAAGETCQLITNTGLGDVGCCTDGQTCSSQLSSGCGDGLTSCPNYPGGGCCIPGYECLDVGCKHSPHIG